MGLVHRVVAGDPLAAAKELAREFTRSGLPALSFARSAVQRAFTSPLAEGLRTEAELSTLAFCTEDSAEGLSAFTEKRKPAFKDR
jgi:enoyl-CoA hydratase